MKLVIAALRDIKVGLYQPPIFVPHIGTAVRALEDAINDPAKNTDISKHPADFELYELGTLDQETGEIESHKPNFIMGGANVSK